MKFSAASSQNLFLTSFLVVALGGAVAGCNSDESKGTGDDGKGDAAAGVEGAVEKAVADAEKEAGADKLFDGEKDKEMRKRACEFLTPELVAKTFGVEASELEQMKMMGCIYSWSSDTETLNVNLMMIRVHKTLERAKSWYESATASRTAEQMQKDMDMVKEKVQERKELDTKLKKKTAADLTDVAKMGMPDEGVTYEDVPGIGDQARASSADGGLWVRIGNLTFQLSAYKGPPEPKIAFDPKNPKGMVKAAMENQKKFLKETRDQRKADALKIAPAVVAAIEAG